MHEAEAAQPAYTTRLHISPFNPSILHALLPRDKRSLIIDISYHATQVEPDKGFGYIELPAAEAEKLRKKLNGTILQGHKMSIEKAKARKRKVEDAGDPEPSKICEKTTKKQKRSRPDTEISGVELPAGRKVKRGWTEAETKSKSTSKGSKSKKSQYSEKSEMLFRPGGKESRSNSKPKTKKKDEGASHVVHEFANSTKIPTFLKQTDSRSGTLTFEDGKGWVDEDGRVVEEVKTRRKPATSSAPAQLEDNASTTLPRPRVTRSKARGISHSSTVADTDDSSGTSELSDSSSDVSSDSSDDAESEVSSETGSVKSSNCLTHTPPTALEKQTPAEDKPEPEAVIAPSTEQPLPGSVESSNNEPALIKPVHPLEALYKRKPEETPKLAPIKTSFSFFEGGEDDVPARKVDSLTIPQTPFTSNDLRFRGLRSAAPTPDTAVASRRFFAEKNEDEDDEDEDGDGAGTAQSSGAALQDQANASGKEPSAWRKKFYERRAELNQNAKQRMRDARKQQRQRENRRLTRQAL